MSSHFMKAGFAGACLLAVMTMPAHAQEYPTKPVRITTGFPTGSGPDAALRLVSERLSHKWGQPIIVENKPGASGIIAVEAVKGAPGDGHHLIMMDSSQMNGQPYLFKNLSYDLFKDFEPITPILRNYFFIVVPTESPYKSVGDLLKDAKARPGKVNYGSWFVGSSGHVGGALLEQASGTQMLHVPYKQMTQLYVGVANKEVDWAFGSAGSTGALRDAGKLRYLAAASPERLPEYPDVPTVSESGGPADFQLAGFMALLATKGTPKSVVEKIRNDVKEVLAEPAILERYKTMLYEPYHLDSEQLMTLLESESKRWGEAIKRANISLD